MGSKQIQMNKIQNCTCIGRYLKRFEHGFDKLTTSLKLEFRNCLGFRIYYFFRFGRGVFVFHTLTGK